MCSDHRGRSDAKAMRILLLDLNARATAICFARQFRQRTHQPLRPGPSQQIIPCAQIKIIGNIRPPGSVRAPLCFRQRQLPSFIKFGHPGLVPFSFRPSFDVIMPSRIVSPCMLNCKMNLPFLNQRTIALAMILAIVSVLWGGSVSWAQGKRLPKPSGHVNDFSEALDSQTKSRLEVVLENLKQRTGLEFMIATVKSVGSQDIYDYSLAVANDWNVGAPATPTKSLLLLIATDSGKFFSQASKSARASLPDGLIGEMGLRMRPKLESGGYSQALLTGIQVFAEILGERNNFTLADVDPQAENLVATRQRPRVVRSARTAPTETPTPQPSESPAPQPTVQQTETLSPQIIPNATPPPVTASPESTQAPEPSVRPRVTQPSETPAVASPSPS